MALKYLVDLDLGGNEIQNFALQTLATAPANPVTGQVYYDTAARAVFVHTGTAWSRVGLTADGSTINVNGDGVISVGTIAISNVSGLQTALDTKLESAALNAYALVDYVDNEFASLPTPAITSNGTTPALSSGISAAEIRTLISAPSTADIAGFATVDYVDTEIASLVSSAPATLDTLNELAAALGDDPNFATTISTSIGTKLDASAYTAADVLAKIKTVDGAGSGLDADLLDGQSSAYYRNYNNLTNKPTIPVYANLQVIGQATPLPIDLGSIGIGGGPVNVQVWENGNQMVLTNITYDQGSNSIAVDLPNGVNFTLAIVGAA